MGTSFIYLLFFYFLSSLCDVRVSGNVSENNFFSAVNNQIKVKRCVTLVTLNDFIGATCSDKKFTRKYQAYICKLQMEVLS